MRFPEQARKGSEVHADALRRLDDARDHQHDMQDALEASKDASSERAAVTELAAASNKAAACEAWLIWVERGY
jgi:hypothetical protein